MSDSVRPHRRQPTRFPCSWDSPGKNTGVGCHFLLQCMKVKSESEVAQLCPSLRDPMDCSPPGSSIPGILQARTLEWGAISFPSAWKWKVKVKLLSRVRLLVTPRTAAHQAPPSMGFSRQEYWSGVPLPRSFKTEMARTSRSVWKPSAAWKQEWTTEVWRFPRSECSPGPGGGMSEGGVNKRTWKPREGWETGKVPGLAFSLSSENTVVGVSTKENGGEGRNQLFWASAQCLARAF